MPDLSAARIKDVNTATGFTVSDFKGGTLADLARQTPTTHSDLLEPQSKKAGAPLLKQKLSRSRDA